MYTLTAYSGIASASGDIAMQFRKDCATLFEAKDEKKALVSSVGLTHVEGNQYRLKAADWVVVITPSDN